MPSTIIALPTAKFASMVKLLCKRTVVVAAKTSLTAEELVQKYGRWNAMLVELFREGGVAKVNTLFEDWPKKRDTEPLYPKKRVICDCQFLENPIAKKKKGEDEEVGDAEVARVVPAAETMSKMEPGDLKVVSVHGMSFAVYRLR